MVTIKLAKKVYHILLDADRPLKLNDIRERIGNNRGLKEVLIFLLSLQVIQREYIYNKSKKSHSRWWHYSIYCNKKRGLNEYS